MNAEDLSICLGNLLDNAIEAVAEIQKEKIIKVKLKADKGNLFINVTNPYLTAKKEKGKYLSHKTDSGEHGFGLMIVKQITEKYKGQMQIQDENGEFAALSGLPHFYGKTSIYVVIYRNRNK